MIPVADLLPHAEPMILLNGYEPQPENDSVIAFVDVTPSSPFYEDVHGGVPSCVALEYMSQAMALLVGLMRRQKGLAPHVGFVLGSRRLELHVSCFKRGRRYRIKTACTYEDDEFGSFDCRIADEDGMTCACGTLTAYQPSNDMLPVDLARYE